MKARASHIAFLSALLWLYGGQASAQNGQPASKPGPYLFDVVKTEPRKSAYARLIAPLRKSQPWLVNADGVAAPAETIMIDGATFEVFSLCKPHDCADNNFQVFFNPGGMAAFGVFRTPKATRFLGEPTVGQRKVLLAALGEEVERPRPSPKAEMDKSIAELRVCVEAASVELAAKSKESADLVAIAAFERCRPYLRTFMRVASAAYQILPVSELEKIEADAEATWTKRAITIIVERRAAASSQ